MIANNGGCDCSGATTERTTAGAAAATEVAQAQTPKIRPGLINRKVTLLISAGAAMAANCEPCLERIVPDLKQAGARDEEIRGAILVGQVVKERPMEIMKAAADRLAGTNLSDETSLEFCPAEEMVKDDNYKVTMLIAAAAAMAANCEFCLNKAVPDLIEAGVSETDIRRAVEIGQAVKDKPAAIMKEAADILTGSELSDHSVSETCSPGESKQAPGCCG